MREETEKSSFNFEEFKNQAIADIIHKAFKHINKKKKKHDLNKCDVAPPALK
ncbi:hypothetical protein Bealeia1_01522 [Candidatus Bealeia paramacronuclearis]|uniref:Uncharacterized protein n=1 Tax=Candidatus Bealeia paramacronuclearis TaxID=1921001 RepID=A0ABZ2C5J0_9PROT|nr:hypothetical protein [Candidatus Bealeia paramacronuclearis]